MGRGARRAPIFRVDEDCGLFVSLLSELKERYDIRVHGFALMPNHYHLMLETPGGRLSRAMSWLLSSFSRDLNRRHDWDGPVFRGRFHNRVVYRDEHWMHLLAYIHLNPVRARLAMKPEQAEWTSHAFYSGAEPTPEWLDSAELLGMFGGTRAYLDYVREVRAKRAEIPDDFDRVAFRGGRRTSDEPVMTKKIASVAVRRAASAKPREALAEVLRVSGTTPADVRTPRVGRGGNPLRVVAAFWLSRRSKVTNAEVGRLIDMWPADVSNAIARVKRLRRAGGEITRLLDALEEITS
jgi:REP element-mobilizing transposase RayT